MTKEEYLAAFTEGDSPGWSAIDAACANIYGPGDPAGHFAPQVPPMLGGVGPDGTSIYFSNDHFHYVTYGFRNCTMIPKRREVNSQAGVLS